jgi:hypothetical protein
MIETLKIIFLIFSFILIYIFFFSTGSGKSSLFYSILGEMLCKEG